MAVSQCMTWFQTQLILTCQIRYHGHCGIIVARTLIPRGYLQNCEVSRLRQLVFVQTKTKENFSLTI